MIKVSETGLVGIPASERVLLLPHCLRLSNKCQGKYNAQGLECRECTPGCAVNILRRAAIGLGYKGVCVAPGGRLAVKFITGMRPRAVVAVACSKELEEGVQEIGKLPEDGLTRPLIAVIPLLKDGCVDTEVNIEEALGVIRTGCPGK